MMQPPERFDEGAARACGAAALQDEMRRRCDGAPFASRIAQPGDAAFLFELFAAVSAELVDLPEPLLRLQFAAREAAYAAEFPGAVRLVLLEHQARVGAFLVDLTPGDCTRGVDLAVLPQHRRGAVGERALRAWTTVSDRMGKPARLQAAPLNPALRLYRRLGFRALPGAAAPIAMERPPRPAPPEMALTSPPDIVITRAPLNRP